MDALRGTFSLAIFDLAARKALCAIDRFGIQTLCYAEPAPGLLVFGSTTDAVRAHPKVGASWETFCIEQLVSHAALVDPASEAFFYRTQSGVEVDLLLRLRGELLAFEMKLGLAVKDTRPMKTAMADLGVRRGYQVNAGDDLVALEKGVWVGGIRPIIEELGMRPA